MTSTANLESDLISSCHHGAPGAENSNSTDYGRRIGKTTEAAVTAHARETGHRCVSDDAQLLSRRSRSAQLALTWTPSVDKPSTDLRRQSRWRAEETTRIRLRHKPCPPHPIDNHIYVTAGGGTRLLGMPEQAYLPRLTGCYGTVNCHFVDCHFVDPTAKPLYSFGCSVAASFGKSPPPPTRRRRR